MGGSGYQGVAGPGGDLPFLLVPVIRAKNVINALAGIQQLDHGMLVADDRAVVEQDPVT
jgi:hypothetical protein